MGMTAQAGEQTSAARPRLLLVDDEENILRSLRRVLRRGEWEIETAPNAEEALKLLHSFAPVVVISDFRMPGMNGVEFLTRVKETSPQDPAHHAHRAGRSARRSKRPSTAPRCSASSPSRGTTRSWC